MGHLPVPLPVLTFLVSTNLYPAFLVDVRFGISILAGTLLLEMLRI